MLINFTAASSGLVMFAYYNGCDPMQAGWIKVISPLQLLGQLTALKVLTSLSQVMDSQNKINFRQKINWFHTWY